MSKKSFVILIGIGFIATYLLFVGVARWGDSTPPEIVLTQPFSEAGPTTPLVIHVSDTDTGLKHISVRIVHNLETFTLVEESFPSHGFLSLDGGIEREYDLEMVPYADTTLPRKKGETKLIVTARDYSWGNFFEGNGERLTQEVTLKFSAPRLELLSPPGSIAQGGSGIVRYRVSREAKEHGIQILSTMYPGFPAPDGNGMFALMAFPHNAKPHTPIQLFADDGFGNRGILDLDYRVEEKNWRTRRIGITDRFIQKTVMPIIAQSPDAQDQGDNLKNFLEVNNKLRRLNNRTIIELGKQSRPEFLWQEAFRQLPGSQVEAAFADHRNYVYANKIVDTQDHLGFDLAVTKHYPVQASNSGIVVFAEYLGIYGNTIVIDHGYGLQSMYAHLSSYEVKIGESVTIGQVIARSGTTGLAAGDHLHFGLVLQGTQVNPTEWWDRFWVKTRIQEPLGLKPQPKGSPKKPQPPQKSFGPGPPPDSSTNPPQ